MLPCSGDSVAGWSSRMPQSRAHTEIFRDSLAGQCPSREKYLEYFSKFRFLMFLAAQSGDLFTGRWSSCGGTQKFSRLTSRLPRGQNFQLRKTLRKFFKIFVLSVLATCSRHNPVAKIACFALFGQFFKMFGFSVEHFQLFIVLSFQLSLKLTVSL